MYSITVFTFQVDYFFVPPLNFIAEKLKLSPSIAGITLLALGNGKCLSLQSKVVALRSAIVPAMKYHSV